VKRFALRLALLALSLGPWPSLAAVAKHQNSNKPTAHRPLKAAASFQFCFEIPHGRCFNTTATGKLRQVGGHNESEAVVAPVKIQGLENEIVSFMKATISAAPRKPRPCQQTLAYRSFDVETLQMKFEARRCLEFVNKTDNASLARLVTKLSLATK
jgi:hypothetical protein